MDILIARLLYPNDVTRTIIPHQNYVALLSNDHIEFYSVSSIPGKELRIKDEKTKRHLESLGVVANGKITVISSRGGNTICVVKGIRLAFNRETASKILVA